MNRIALTEYHPILLHISRSDQQLLQQLRFDVQLDFQGSGVWVNAGSKVGVLRLPSGTILDIRPKVPLRNLLWMLSTVLDLDVRFLNETVPLNTFEDVLEHIARYFTELVERQIDLGLYRNYVEVEENLASLRGRIVIAEDIRQNLILRQRTWCRYADFSWDLPENQVIRQVVQMLAGWGFSEGMTSRLVALDVQLGEIHVSQFTAQDIDQFVYNRQSQAYEPIHQLCRLFLDGASLSEAAGDVDFDGFLLDMNTLFEMFISRQLWKRLSPPWSLAMQYRSTLDERGEIRIRPDLVIMRSGEPVLIADCKYKQLSSGEHRNTDVYQLLAYATVFTLPVCMLIYPQYEKVIDARTRVRNSPVVIREISIDLSSPVSRIESDLNELAGTMIDWVRRA